MLNLIPVYKEGWSEYEKVPTGELVPFQTAEINLLHHSLPPTAEETGKQVFRPPRKTWHEIVVWGWNWWVSLDLEEETITVTGTNLKAENRV